MNHFDIYSQIPKFLDELQSNKDYVQHVLDKYNFVLDGLSRIFDDEISIKTMAMKDENLSNALKKTTLETIGLSFYYYAVLSLKNLNCLFLRKSII